MVENLILLSHLLQVEVPQEMECTEMEHASFSLSAVATGSIFLPNRKECWLLRLVK